MIFLAAQLRTIKGPQTNSGGGIVSAKVALLRNPTLVGIQHETLTRRVKVLNRV